MARPARKLIDRVLDGSFRPDRHKPLLASERLPRAVPRGVDRDLWRSLRLVQSDFVDVDNDRERKDLAYEFADLADRVAAAQKEDLGIAGLLLETLIAPEAPGTLPPVGVDPDEWEVVEEELAEWEAAYGPAYRARLGLAVDDADVDTLEPGIAIPEPPGLDLVDHLARAAG